MLRYFSLVTAALFIVCPLHAGVVFEIETKDHDQSPPRTSSTRVTVEGRNLSIDIAPQRQGERGGNMLFRGGRREMVVVDHQGQSYFVIDAQTFRKMSGQINQALGQSQTQIQQAMQGVPPEQRAMIEQMMKERMPAQQTQQQPKVEVRRANQTAEVYGYSCELFEVRRGGRKIRDMWVTDWNNIPGGRELAPAFAGMASFHQEMLEAVPNFGGNTKQMTDNVFATMKEINGFPVASRDYADDGSVESESALRSANSQRIDPAAFEPPTGYKRQQMFSGSESLAPPANTGFPPRQSRPRR